MPCAGPRRTSSPIRTGPFDPSYGFGFTCRRAIRLPIQRPMEENAMSSNPEHNGNQAFSITKAWNTDPRWRGIERPYTARDVVRLRGSVVVEHTLARLGAQRLWDLLHTEGYVPALGALTGNQAVQQVQAGLKRFPAYRPDPLCRGSQRYQLVCSHCSRRRTRFRRLAERL